MISDQPINALCCTLAFARYLFRFLSTSVRERHLLSVTVDILTGEKQVERYVPEVWQSGLFRKVGKQPMKRLLDWFPTRKWQLPVTIMEQGTLEKRRKSWNKRVKSGSGLFSGKLPSGLDAPACSSGGSLGSLMARVEI
jgi:hypothetical protein